MDGMQPSDPQMMMASATMGMGGLFVFMNWVMLLATWITGRFHSRIPLVGATLLAIGALLTPGLRLYAWGALLIDLGTLEILPHMPTIIREIWSSPRFK